MANKEPFSLKHPALLRPEVLTDFEISDRDKIIYSVISSIIGGKQSPCWLTNEEIGNACAKSEKSIERAIKVLSDKQYIYIDVDRKRPFKGRTTKDKAIRHIYTDYKYYCDRNKQHSPIPSKFRNFNHFLKWGQVALRGFQFRGERINGNKLQVAIADNGYLKNLGLDKELHSIDEKGDIYKMWKDLYKNKDICTKWYEENKLNKKEEK